MNEEKKPDKTAEEDLVEEVRDLYKSAKKHTANWRVEVVENNDFVANRQWSEEDSALLEEQGRPVVTFNRMGPYFDAISGTQINNRQEIKYLPRTTGDNKTNEVLQAAVKWVTGQTNAEDEESDAFDDTICNGMGWIETRMEYDDDPDGKIVMERVDPLEMYWDPTAKKKNLQDAKWLQRVKWLSKEEIKSKWPNLEVNPAATPWGDEGDIKAEPHNASLAFLYRENSRDGYDEKTGKYRVVQHLYYETGDVYRVADPQSGKLVTLSPEKFELAKKLLGEGLKHTKQKQKKYKVCFIVGDQIAEAMDLKCGFNIKCITGKRDKNTNTWYGLARVMKDPQRWANKFLAQIMHIVNSNAKGGLLAEEGAFKDAKKAEENWTDPTAIVWLKNGGLQKVKDRMQAAYPVGLDKLLQFAVSSIPDVTGVNVEFLGNADREQAGVLEQERKKSVYVILAGFFNSLRLYRKEQGRLLAHFVKEYLNDGRIIRITTDFGEVPVPLNLTDDVISYDVIVDQAPTSPNLKEEVWTQLNTLIPAMLKAGVPPPPEVFLFSPLPESVARAYAARMNGVLPPEAQQKMQELQGQVQQLSQENFTLKSKESSKIAQISSKHELGKEQNAIAAQKNAIDSQAAIADLKKELIAIAEQSRADMIKLRAEMERDARESHQKMMLEIVSAKLEHSRKREEAAMKAQERREQAAEKEKDRKEKEKDREAQSKASSEQKPPVINITNVIPKGGKKTVKTPKGEKYTVEED